MHPFVVLARRATREPAWDLVAALTHPGPPPPAVLRRCAVSPEDWARWEPAVHAPTLCRALALCPAAPPVCVALALAARSVRSPADARALRDLALPRRSLPLGILAVHALARFSLAALLPPLTARLPASAHESFYLNALLHAIARFDRSRVAANAAIDVLAQMDTRAVPLWPNTERALIRDDFRSPQLLRRLRPHPENRDLWLRAHASFADVPQTARCLRVVTEHCLQHGLAPPYTDDGQGAPHKANTHYLRAMRDDRHAAFRYFHHLLGLDLAKSPSSSPKSNIDIYDWTTALYAAAHDRTLPATTLLDLFRATKEGTYQPTRATYTVVIQGLLWRNALQDAQSLWDEFVRALPANPELYIDRKALCVGVDVLVQSRRTQEALSLLDDAFQRNFDRLAPTSPYLKVHPIHALLSALLRIRRPDAVYFVWTHLATLYLVPPTNLMLRILLKAAIQASKMDSESIRGTMRWCMADRPHHDLEVQDRETLVGQLHALLHNPAPPPVVGIWAGRRSTDVARSVFRGMVFGNWPALAGAGAQNGGVTRARARGGDSLWEELARVWARRPDRVLPGAAVEADGGTERPGLGPALPTVVPSESTFATYVALLGLSSRAEEIPEVLGWMRALGVRPKTGTLAVALVFWMEVGLRGPVFEDGWRRGEAPPRTEYAALRAWISEWVGEKRAPTEEDVCAGIKRVWEMRQGRFGGYGSGVRTSR